ncbi:MAG: putative quinol monooxygenase [Bacteroidales bacterium]|jgi:quinol monooxygenase YgiN
MKAKLLVLLFSLALISSSYGSKKTGEDTKSTGKLLQVSGTDYGMMIVAKLTVKPEKVKAFTEAAKEMIEKSNKETGCKSYQLYQDPYDNTKFIFVEEYKNQAAVDAHFASDYFKAFGPKISDFIAEPSKIKIITMAKEENK